MRYINPLLILFLLCSPSVSAHWQKINEADYIWGPFKIYHLSLFTETGNYTPQTRPIMLTLQYAKPVDGRDFAISLARSWSNLGITLPEQDDVVDRLRKVMPDIKKDDMLSYIALEDKGYFVFNNQVIPEEFNQDFNNAVLAVWLDPRVEIGRKLLNIKLEDTLPATTPEAVVKPQPETEAPKPKQDDSEIEITPPIDSISPLSSPNS